MSDPREPAREQAEEAYHGFINYMKYFSYLALAGIVFVSSCNFGVDGTGIRVIQVITKTIKNE